MCFIVMRNRTTLDSILHSEIRHRFSIVLKYFHNFVKSQMPIHLIENCSNIFVLFLIHFAQIVSKIRKSEKTSCDLYCCTISIQWTKHHILNFSEWYLWWFVINLNNQSAVTINVKNNKRRMHNIKLKLINRRASIK